MSIDCAGMQVVASKVELLFPLLVALGVGIAFPDVTIAGSPGIG